MINRTVYCVIGLNQEGYKDRLGTYIGENEGAKFWLQVLTDLHNRGVEDYFMPAYITFQTLRLPYKASSQLCVLHQMRNSIKYLTYKDVKALLTDLKQVYQASTKELAEKYLSRLEVHDIPRSLNPGRAIGISSVLTLMTMIESDASFTLPTS